MKTILLPTDFSENSKNAINYAMSLCENFECTFYILNVQKQSEFLLDDLMTTPVGDSIHQAVFQDNKKELKQFMLNLKEEYKNKNFSFKSLFAFNSLTDAINQTISSKEIDLIIMGTNGATGAKEVIFGSNTINVIRKVNCPIITIPENYKFSKIKSILFSTEDCKDFNKEGIKPLTDILSKFNADLSVLDLDFTNYPEEENNSDSLKHLFDKQSFKYHNVAKVPSPMVISTITQLHEYQIHALFIESKSFFERFIYGSSDTDEISYNSQIPLLILRK